MKMWKQIAFIIVIGIGLLYLTNVKRKEGMEVCPDYLPGGLLTQADIAALQEPKLTFDDSRAPGISINLKVLRAMPSGAALNSKEAVTRIF